MPEQNLDTPTKIEPKKEATNWPAKSLEISNNSAYYQHEQWFELDHRTYRKVVDGGVEIKKAIRVVNSYGRVRDVFEDGGYKEISEGGDKGHMYEDYSVVLDQR